MYKKYDDNSFDDMDEEDVSRNGNRRNKEKEKKVKDDGLDVKSRERDRRNNRIKNKQKDRKDKYYDDYDR